MKYIIKYGLMVALLVSIAVNIIEPSTEHRLLQAIIAIGILMFLYIEWSMAKIYKKLLQEIKNVPKDNEKTSTPSSDVDF